MDPKLIYWTGALLNMAVVAGLAVQGVRQIRRGEVARHRRSMLLSISLVLAFIGSYVFKLMWLGRENLAVWSVASVRTLQVHELCITAMLLGGGFALYRGLGLRKTRLVTHHADDPDPDPRHVRAHRRAGRIAVGGAVLGWLTAAFVLFGMFSRAGA
jgi:uncharacterized membrane protein YozB (DUF420 family)